MQRRLLRVTTLILGGALCFVLLVWAAWRFGFGIPCIFYTVTGLQCPGCGGWRMVLSLLEGDLREAFALNPALLLLSPALVWLPGSCLYRYVKQGTATTTRLQNNLALCLLVILLVFGVLRNL